jgi:hypothetical protein
MWVNVHTDWFKGILAMITNKTKLRWNSVVNEHSVKTNEFLRKIVHFSSQINLVTMSPGYHEQKWPVPSSSLLLSLTAFWLLKLSSAKAKHIELNIGFFPKNLSSNLCIILFLSSKCSKRMLMDCVHALHKYLLK